MNSLQELSTKLFCKCHQIGQFYNLNNMQTIQLIPRNKMEIDVSRNNRPTIQDIPIHRPKFRTLGRSPRLSAAYTHKRTESEFLIMRNIIEMGEIRKANAKKAQQIDARSQYAASKYKSLSDMYSVEESRRQARPPPPRPVRRTKSTLKMKPREKFTLSHVKKMSIADFKMAKKIQEHHYTPTCSRKNDPKDLYYNRNSMHCDLFGPGLCPDCLRLEARHEFTQTQNELFPFLDAHPRALVAESKIRSLFNPRYVKSSWQIAGRKDIGWNILRNVCTEHEICNRMKSDSRVNIFKLTD